MVSLALKSGWFMPQSPQTPGSATGMVMLGRMTPHAAVSDLETIWDGNVLGVMTREAYLEAQTVVITLNLRSESSSNLMTLRAATASQP